MTHPAGRRIARAISALALAVAGLGAAGLGALTGPTAAVAQGLFTQPKYAAIVEDANTGEVLYTMRADALRHPASITKIMTLYLTFEALSTGRLRMGDIVTISPHAFSMMPSKVSTHAGEQLSVAEAIPAMTVHSANDVAVAMAEKISGSEARFAELMTERARELGMTSTSFVNASGLPPDGEQITTARDMAILSRAVMRDYPQYYHFFGLKSITYRGKLLMNHNHLVARMPGVDGMKTGYTSLAGFNLVASGVREGHRLIVVVLGGPSVAARDENVEELLDAGYTVLRDRTMGQRVRLASLIASPDDMSGPVARPPVEMGSADQQNLQVEVAPQLRTPPTMTAAQALSTPPTEPDAAAAHEVAEDAAAPTACAQPARTRRHRARHAGAACEPVATAPAKTAAPQIPDQIKAVAKVDDDKPCSTHERRRHRAACEARAKAEKTQTASVAKDTKAKVAKTTAAVATAKSDMKPAAKASVEKGGGYMIQVGAYKSHALAAGQVSKLSSVVAGSGLVQQAGGNYRARFSGFSQAQAKSACKTLAAKGQACMVLLAG